MVVAGEAAEIEARVEGRIEAVFVQPGQTVARGAPIARLDHQAATHELAAARAALTDASRRYSRRRRLARVAGPSPPRSWTARAASCCRSGPASPAWRR